MLVVSCSTGSAIDLSGYSLELYSNGSSSFTFSTMLTGNIADGDVFVIAHSSADPAILAEADTTNSFVIGFNGDDAVVLRNGGAIIDVIGQIGNDPGSEWFGGGIGTQNETLRRKSSITEGDTNGGDAFDNPQVFIDAANIPAASGGNTSFFPIGLVADENFFYWADTDRDSIYRANLDGSNPQVFNDRANIPASSGGSTSYSPSYITIVTVAGTSILLAIAPTDATKAEGDSGNTTFTFTVTRSGDTSGTTTVEFATLDGTAIDGVDYTGTFGTVTFDPGDTSETITVDVIGDTDVEPNENFTVTLFNPSGGATISTANADGIIQNDDGVSFTLIHDIQGSGSTSPLVGNTVTIEGIVVGDFQDGDGDTGRDLRGFYVQEEDGDADGNALTSEGIFTFENGNFITDVNAGDLVQVTGTVAEFFEETQIDTVTDITVVSSGNPLPTAASISLPAGATTTNQDGDLQNEIIGTPGSDILTGTAGGDRITGGPGLDQIDISSGGNDEIIYTQLIDTPDIITGFTVGSDEIDLSGILAQIGYGGSDPIGDGYLVFQQSGANTLIQFDVDGTATRGIPRSIILVNGVDASDLGQPSNFILS